MPLRTATNIIARVPSAAACHDTMKAVSTAIIEQLNQVGQPISRSASNSSNSPGRCVLRCAPMSSSRDEPHPNEMFPAPLPPVALPYELSLLDNLFLNPRAAHNKISDYTDGNQSRANKLANEVRTGYAPNMTMSFGAPPQGFPPGAFQGGYNDTPVNGSGLGAYGIAAQVGMPGLSATQPNAMNMTFPPQQMNAETESNGFDVFSFLMDEEGGLNGAGTWDAMEVPPDFSLWS